MLMVTKCARCGNQNDSRSLACAHCGRFDLPAKTYIAWLILTLLVGVIGPYCEPFAAVAAVAAALVLVGRTSADGGMHLVCAGPVILFALRAHGFFDALWQLSEYTVCLWYIVLMPLGVHLMFLIVFPLLHDSDPLPWDVAAFLGVLLTLALAAVEATWPGLLGQRIGAAVRWRWGALWYVLALSGCRSAVTIGRDGFPPWSRLPAGWLTSPLAPVYEQPPGLVRSMGMCAFWIASISFPAARWFLQALVWFAAFVGNWISYAVRLLGRTAAWLLDLAYLLLRWALVPCCLGGLHLWAVIALARLTFSYFNDLRGAPLCRLGWPDDAWIGFPWWSCVVLVLITAASYAICIGSVSIDFCPLPSRSPRESLSSLASWDTGAGRAALSNWLLAGIVGSVMACAVYVVLAVTSYLMISLGWLSGTAYWPLHGWLYWMLGAGLTGMALSILLGTRKT